MLRWPVSRFWWIHISKTSDLHCFDFVYYHDGSCLSNIVIFYNFLVFNFPLFRTIISSSPGYLSIPLHFWCCSDHQLRAFKILRMVYYKGLPPNYPLKIPWFFPDPYCFSLTKTNNSIISGHIPELQHTQYLQPLPLKIIKKFILCPFLLKLPSIQHFFLMVMCRLFRTLNDIKHYKALNFPSISTWTNILLNLIWEKLHEKQRYHGIINTRDYLNCKWVKAKGFLTPLFYEDPL